jgi:4-hydroxy-3-polyprenylbenzoate decarboxylase
MSAPAPHPLVVAITGASGAPYAVRLLEQLLAARQPVQLILSAHGLRLLQTETELVSVDDLRVVAGAAAWDELVTVFDDGDRGAAPASGSARNRGMVICPCSMGTISAISQGTSRSLVERAADVALKERRRLVLVPRETPLSTIQLENMLRVRRAGAHLLPAMPAFYQLPKSLDDLADFMAGKIMSALGFDHDLYPPWTGKVSG